MKKNLLLIAISVALVGSAAAQSPKASDQRKSKPAAKTEANVDGKLSVLSSHIKSIGTVGKTDRYTIISARIRGLDSPNISALLAYDEVSDTLAVLASGVEPGLGVAIVNGGATVGGNFLFGSKLRPDRTSVNNNSDSNSDADAESEGGDALSVSKSQGGSAVSISDADAKSSVRNENSNSSVNVNSNQQSQNQSSVNNNSSKNNGGKTHIHNNNHNKPKKSKKGGRD